MAKKALTVDDTTSMRKMVAFALKQAGFDAIEAPDGQAGLNEAKKQAFDLIVTDQNMPGMDGLTLIKTLRGLPQYQSTPILMLTTEAGDTMKAQGRAAGATGWVVKPFDPQRFIDLIKKITA